MAAVCQIERLETYFEALEVKDERKRPFLLHLGGADIHTVSKAVTEAVPHTYATLKDAISAHFEPYANPDYERFLLRQAHEKSEESVDVFYAHLRKLASTCTLPDEEDDIRAQFIQGCASSKLRQRILQEPNMRMRDILTLGRSQELCKARAAHMEQSTTVQVKTEPINAVATGTSKSRAMQGGVKMKDKLCTWCGGSLPHPGSCTARGKTCSGCGKLNHFAKLCRSTPKAPPTPKKRVKAVAALPNTSSESDMDDDTASCPCDKGATCSRRLPTYQVTMQSQSIPASIDLMAAEMFYNLKTERKPTKVLVYAFGSTRPLMIMGVFTADVEHESTKLATEVYVSKKESGFLLSCQTAQDLVHFAFSTHANCLGDLTCKEMPPWHGYPLTFC
ncbi:hypothetical protein NDU88_007535 [Pleurodeles waltl]|uniref:Uncharacterized protein n=1 Tax=Pleurodeles waltl TaxID=8319 RepID=A0AAV7U0C8_PLEWA|nr:hypothetical protein NDU88_007535 [Pleurodeles waltl]